MHGSEYLWRRVWLCQLGSNRVWIRIICFKAWSVWFSHVFGYSWCEIITEVWTRPNFILISIPFSLPVTTCQFCLYLFTRSRAEGTTSAFSDISRTSKYSSVQGQTYSASQRASTPSVGAPYFLIQPKNKSVPEGEDVKFVAECEGKPMPKGTNKQIFKLEILFL